MARRIPFSTNRLLARIAIFTAVGSVSAAARPSFANGRFPNADHMAINPTEPSHIAVRATFGLVQTFDGGDTWSWLCEPAVGYGGTDDPAIGITGLGHLLVGIRSGVAQGSIGGCDFTTDATATANLRIVDLAVDVVDPSVAIAISGDGADGAPRVVVSETVDEGATWTALGPDLADDLFPQTIDAAPTNRDRLYVSAVAGVGNAPVIERSSDRGKSWTRFAIDIPGAERTFISAVSPFDEDTVYLRVTGETEDRLFWSEDGAETWTELITLEGQMLGFALSPDGSKVAVGLKQGGVYVASTTDHDFAQTSEGGVRCLSWGSAGLYACANEGDDGFTVGRSDDDGASFTPLYHLLDIVPIDCPAGTDAGDACPPLFDELLDQLGNTGAGGSPSSSSAGGAGGGGGGSSGEDGCSCETRRPARSYGWLPLATLLSAFIARRSRSVMRSIALTNPG